MKLLRMLLHVLALSALLTVGAKAQSNLLTAGDFEGINSLTTYWPATPGVWGTESAALLAAGNGISALGSQMLQINHAGGGTAAQTAQIVQGPFTAGSTVTFTAKFNTWRTGQAVRLDIMTNAGLALDGARFSSPTVTLDSDTSTWETVTATVTLASDTNYLAAEIIGAQGSNGSLYGTPLAYVDDAVLTVTPPRVTQTLTILGGSGSAGEIAANVDYYNPSTGNWQPAYLMGYHPWGYVSGTNSWINYKPSSGSDVGAGPTVNQTLWYLYRVRFTVPEDAIDPKMTFSLKADNFAQVAINGVLAGGTSVWINNTTMNNVIVGTTDQFNADAVFSQAVHPGENVITLNIGDFGGLNGFNFRIDLSMQSSQPLEIVPSDTTPPVISGPGNITTEATGPSGAVVNFTATATDDVDGAVPVVAMPESGSTFALGTTTVDLGASDSAGNQAFATFTVTVQDTTPPIITTPADLTVEATGPDGADVNFSVSAADTVDGVVAATANPGAGTFSIGTTVVNVSATDNAGNTANSSFNVTVQDTTAPVISSVTPSTGVLWSPNHKMVPITVSVDAADLTGVASVKIISVTSSEPDNGLGDGDTANDTQITGPLSVNLRSERSGKGNGRIYTITVEVTDAYGNSSTSTCTVSVPKSQGKGK